MLDIWDEQLSEFAFKIYQYRKFYIEKIYENINSIHKMITKCGKHMQFYNMQKKGVILEISNIKMTCQRS